MGINGTFSNLAHINISVLQGSILGPILFLCFINDLPNISKLLLLLFADDTGCLASDSNLNNLITFCNDELHKIANWMLANKMAINTNKCKFILFHNRGKKIDPNNLKIHFNLNEIGKPIDPDKIFPLERIMDNAPNHVDRSYKYLGILLDEHFSLNNHIDLICKKTIKGIILS